MKVTLLGVLSFIAAVALLGYVLHELQQQPQKNESLQPNPKPIIPPQNL